ncbi:MAG: sigma-70 family RNA polymerase sigma factor [Alicyclobacillus macrosporangiidus]|nr:sigma-70 family RNA polymerase sigma factor [Alicyclobacillus macrosporangiidus]
MTTNPIGDQVAVKEAIHSLYELYSHDIYRYAVMMLGNPSDAHDAVQEVFLRAFRAWTTYRHDAGTKTCPSSDTLPVFVWDFGTFIQTNCQRWLVYVVSVLLHTRKLRTNR